MFSSEQLLSPGLDTGAYLRYALHASSLTAEQTRLSGCLDQLKEDMQSLLAENVDGMVGQLQAAHTAQRDVSSARQSVDSLTRATDRLRVMIEEPYNTIQGKVTELENTNQAVDVLRDVLTFITLSSRLQELMAPAAGSSSPGTGKTASAAGATPPVPSTSPSLANGKSSGSDVELDITRAARSLKELEDLCAVADLRGIEVVESRMGIVEKFSTTVRNRTHELLSVQELLKQKGGPSAPPLPRANGRVAAPGASPALSRTVLDMGTALQCAYTLGSLTKVVHGFMVERKREALRVMMRELDPQVIAEDASARANRAGGGGGSSGGAVGVVESLLGPGSAIAGGGGGGARELLQCTQDALLSHIQAALFTVVQHTQCAILLWRVLLRRQDALTQVPLFRALESPEQILVDYWNTVMDRLRERLVALQKRSEFEAALAAAYPQFRMLLESLLSSSGDLTGAAAAATVAAVVGGGGSGSNAGPGAGAGTGGAMSDTGASLLLFNMPQWGLGDYLDLLQVVDAAAHPSTVANALPRRAGTAYDASAASGVETSKATWLSLVSDDLQRRFSAQLMDRHREKMNPVLSKLSTLVPSSSAAGSQPVNVNAADARRGQLPPAATALDPSGYTRLALQDCYAYRQDPLALGLSVACVLTSVEQLLTRMREATARHPLPPLPAVTTSVTRTQLMHICLANSCTVLVEDLSNILALLPEQNGKGVTEDTGKTDAAEHASEERDETAAAPRGGGVVGELAHRQRRLREVIEAFRMLSEASALPFLSSARVTLMPAVAYCVEVACNAVRASGGKGGEFDNRATLQLSTRLDVFLNHFFLLVDPRTSAWADGTRRLADALMARLLAQCVAVGLCHDAPGAASSAAPTAAAALNRGLVNCLQEALIALLSFASATQGSLSGTVGGPSGGVGRSTLKLKGSAKQMELFYSALGGGAGADKGRLTQELQAILRPLYPLLAHLLLVQQARMQQQQQQQQPGTTATSPLPFPFAKTEAFVSVVEQGLMSFCQTAPPPASAVAERQNHLSPEDLAEQTQATSRTAAEHFQRLVSTAPAPAAAADSAGIHTVLSQVWASVPPAS